VLGSQEIGFPVAQNEESVDFAPHAGAQGSDLVIEGANDYRGFFDTIESPNLTSGQPQPNAWGFGVTGYYVHTGGDDCSPTFEGAFPHLYYPPTQDNSQEGIPSRWPRPFPNEFSRTSIRTVKGFRITAEGQ
jgi:hypothetical protein